MGIFPEIPSNRGGLDLEVLLKCSICLGDTTVTRILFNNGAKLEKISWSNFVTIAKEFFEKINTRKYMLLLLLEHGLVYTVENCWEGEINFWK